MEEPLETPKEAPQEVPKEEAVENQQPVEVVEEASLVPDQEGSPEPDGNKIGSISRTPLVILVLRVIFF